MKTWHGPNATTCGKVYLFWLRFGACQQSDDFPALPRPMMPRRFGGKKTTPGRRASRSVSVRRRAALIAPSMPSGHHVLKSIPSGVPIPVLARNEDPALACSTLPRAIVLGVDIEQCRKIAG